ncbi:hypothetical protein [Providencia rettgeri]|uniref:hypothetical protein n=1 Tax=Providencia rettgeri TaxID=587 RepID=UPI000D7DA9F5|nr:hypothetical protein [Providencia rettgeri]AWS50759.1 hypothetical protein AM461_08015 [Providencia rettgeri]
MKFIEFDDKYNKGLILPIEHDLIITGAKGKLEKNALRISECLADNVRLEFKFEGEKIYLLGWRKKPVKLKDNAIYSVFGISFFVFTEGERKPKIKTNIMKKYFTQITLFIVFNLILIFFVFYFFKIQQGKNVYDLLINVGNAYIKQGVLYVSEQSIKEEMPLDWKENTQVIDKVGHQRITNLNIDVVSKEGGKIPIELVDKGDYTQVIIDNSEIMLKVMKVFGENGITFKYKNDSWFVDDITKANWLLISSGLEEEMLRLKNMSNKADVIDSASFPYSVFFSSQGRSYIYDPLSRYWVGSFVDNIGRIESISKDKVIFKKGNKTKIYYIPKS